MSFVYLKVRDCDVILFKNPRYSFSNDDNGMGVICVFSDFFLYMVNAFQQILGAGIFTIFTRRGSIILNKETENLGNENQVNLTAGKSGVCGNKSRFCSKQLN